VVPHDENRRKAARYNYAYYKQRGYKLDYHNIN